MFHKHNKHLSKRTSYIHGLPVLNYSLGLSHELCEDKPKILFVTGAFCLGIQFSHWLSLISAQDNSAYAMDYRGRPNSLRSNPTPGNISLYDYVEDVLTVVDELGSENTILVGHSMGGLVGQIVADRRRKLKGLVLLASASTYGWRQFTLPALFATRVQIPNKDEHFILKAKTFRKLMFNKVIPAMVPTHMDSLTWESARAARDIVFGKVIHVEQAHCPLLIIVPKEDKFLKPSYQKKILGESTERRECEEISGGHMPHLEPRHMESLQLILDFAKSLV